MRFGIFILLLGVSFPASFLNAQRQMHVVSSVRLPEVWKKMGWGDLRASCRENGDFIVRLVPESHDLPHDIVRIGGNGSMLAHFDLRGIPGFENGAILDVSLNSAGAMVLFVSKIISTESQPHLPASMAPPSGGWSFRMDPTRWVLSVDDSGSVLSKFSFDQRIVTGLGFALFRSGNVVVTGIHYEGQHNELSRPGALIFSPTGAIQANLELPFTPKRAPLAEPLGLIAGGGDEVFLVHQGTEPYLLKVSADGAVGPKVMLAVPKDERVRVEKIDGHHALASVAQAQRIHGVWKTPQWVPKALFDTESGALLETLLVPSGDEHIVCYSESEMTALQSPKGTLDSLLEDK